MNVVLYLLNIACAIVLASGANHSPLPSIFQVFVSQQATSSALTSSFPLDLLKLHPPPTLLTDGNGNHYLIAVTSRSAPHGKGAGRITLQVVGLSVGFCVSGFSETPNYGI